MKSQITDSEFQKNPNFQGLVIRAWSIFWGFETCDLEFSPEVAS